MGILNLTESERNEILNLHNNAKIIKEQASTVATTTPPTAPPTAAPLDRKSKIMAIQNALNSKHKSNLKVDGILGPNTLGALSTALKSKGGAVTTPAASTTTAPASTTTTPAASTTTAPASTTTTPAASTTTAPESVGAEAPQQLNQASQQALSGQLTPQQIRQQSRFDQRLARQARRTARRAQQ